MALLALIDTRPADLIRSRQAFQISPLRFQKPKERRGILYMLRHQMDHALRTL